MHVLHRYVYIIMSSREEREMSHMSKPYTNDRKLDVLKSNKKETSNKKQTK